MDALRSPQAPISRSSLGRQVSQSTALLLISIGALILFLAILILFHQNANATKGYMLRTLERERSRLLLEEETLNMQVAEAQSLQKLHEDGVIQAMQNVKKPRFIEQDATVAKKPQ